MNVMLSHSVLENVCSLLLYRMLWYWASTWSFSCSMKPWLLSTQACDYDHLDVSYLGNRVVCILIYLCQYITIPMLWVCNVVVVLRWYQGSSVSFQLWLWMVPRIWWVLYSNRLDDGLSPCVLCDLGCWIVLVCSSIKLLSVLMLQFSLQPM